MARIEGISYRTEEGEGRPVVFIHGWLGSRQSWTQVENRLDVDNPRVFYDQRCHGESSCSKFNFPDLAEDLHTLVEELGLEDPVLVGHSMGGMVALTYAVNYDRFSGLFLLGTCASAPEPESGSPRFFLKKFGTMDRDAWAEEIVENYAGESDLEQVKQETRKQLVEAGDTEVIYGLGSMVGYDLTDKLDTIDTDIAVVAGKKDGAITMEKSRELADLLDCPLHKLDASHLMLQEAPGKVAELLEDFLDDTTS